ncbi:hypothetical protein [Azospirillum picis]|uniref:Uncharacterized protein YoxC n=1 Tax=Azospirillum picis TaxID=488438 RepID=A0ABU0MGC3_9PROT|nr:hypothetical protein [Azospirillum picis]MBP2298461.1 uncharacterized protein YoxC [Azospirillum picis]MDQ0532490.1 uncharacterized protein YoxC [Azospirillum picis]
MSSTTLFLIAIAIITLAAVPVAMLLKDFLPDLIEKSSGLERMENRLYVLHAEVHELQSRVDRLARRRDCQSSDRQRLETEIRKIERHARELAEQPPMFVHEVGDPQAGLLNAVEEDLYRAGAAGAVA